MMVTAENAHEEQPNRWTITTSKLGLPSTDTWPTRIPTSLGIKSDFHFVSGLSTYALYRQGLGSLVLTLVAD